SKAVYVELSKILANTFVLYLKTHNFHWNVIGSDFPQLHKLFDDQYKDLWESIDDIAEQIRALGFFVPGTMSALKNMSSITEEESVSFSKEMVTQLADDHMLLVDKILRPAFKVAEEEDLQEIMD